MQAIRAIAALAASLFSGCIAIDCLPLGTEIATPLGPTPIEALVPGDLVSTAAGGSVRVVATRRYKGRELHRVVFADRSEFRATHRHPVFTDRRWVCVGDLAPGDRVVRRGAFVRVVRVVRGARATVIALDVEALHEYVADGVRVHNKTLISTQWYWLRREWEGLSVDGSTYFRFGLPVDDRQVATVGAWARGNDRGMLEYRDWTPTPRGGFEIRFALLPSKREVVLRAPTIPGRRFEAWWTGDVNWAGEVELLAPRRAPTFGRARLGGLTRRSNEIRRERTGRLRVRR